MLFSFGNMGSQKSPVSILEPLVVIVYRYNRVEYIDREHELEFYELQQSEVDNY